MQNYICVRRRGYIWSFTWGGLARKKSNRKTCVSFKSYQWFLGTKLMEVLWICYEFLHRCLLHPLACVVNSSNQFPIYWVEEFYRIQGGCISRGFSSFLNFKLACCTTVVLGGVRIGYHSNHIWYRNRLEPVFDCSFENQ